MSVIELNIKKPTTISAGAVAKDGIAVKIGAKNIDSANTACPDNADMRRVHW